MRDHVSPRGFNEYWMYEHNLQRGDSWVGLSLQNVRRQASSGIYATARSLVNRWWDQLC